LRVIDLPTSYDAMVLEVAGQLPARVQRPMPAPGPHEVLVRVRASSMNYHDLVNLLGLISGPLPRVPMSDGAGEVIAVGSDVTEISPGDRVMSTFYPLWQSGRPKPDNKGTVPGDTCDGWLQQYVVAAANTVVAAPAHLSDTQTATLPCAATTAWSALETGGVAAGDVVVTLGTGGVSLFAMQLAKARGATVIATTSSDDKAVTARAAGADHVINYRKSPEWWREVRQVVPAGADLVIDLGGEQTLAGSIAATRMDGTVAVAGVLSGFGAASVPVSQVMTRNIRLVGVTVGSVQGHSALSKAVEQAGIVPHISHEFSWDELGEAMRVMQAGEHIGKIVVTIPELGG
jgi:NADPH:quinone reductase-like Zn-dependent oxidoreductase